MAAIYPGVIFIAKGQWQQKNAELNDGLGKLAVSLISRKAEIAQQRAQNGTQARFAHLTNKEFPGGFTR